MNPPGTAQWQPPRRNRPLEPLEPLGPLPHSLTSLSLSFFYSEMKQSLVIDAPSESLQYRFPPFSLACSFSGGFPPPTHLSHPPEPPTFLRSSRHWHNPCHNSITLRRYWPIINQFITGVCCSRLPFPPSSAFKANFYRFLLLLLLLLLRLFFLFFFFFFFLPRLISFRLYFPGRYITITMIMVMVVAMISADRPT